MADQFQSLVAFKDYSRFPLPTGNQILDIELTSIHNSIQKLAYQFQPQIAYNPVNAFGANVLGGVGNGVLTQEYQIQNNNNCLWKGVLQFGGTTFTGGGAVPFYFIPPFPSQFLVEVGVCTAVIGGVYTVGNCSMIAPGANLNFYLSPPAGAGVVTGVAPAFAAGDALVFAINYKIIPPLS